METIHTRIWQEEAEPDNAFAALSCHCHGYDVYGDLLVHASWIEYFFSLEHISCDLPPPILPRRRVRRLYQRE